MRNSRDCILSIDMVGYRVCRFSGMPCNEVPNECCNREKEFNMSKALKYSAGQREKQCVKK